jgi:hypothetical protein
MERRKKDIEQEAFFGFAGFDDGAVFAAVEEGGAVVHGEAAFEFVAGVALAAVFAEEGDDLVIEVNACVESGGGGGEEEEAGGELHDGYTLDGVGIHRQKVVPDLAEGGCWGGHSPGA